MQRTGITEAVRHQLELLYEDSCTVISYEPKIEEETGITKTEEKILYADLPCRLSFSSSQTVSGDMPPQISQSVKLFVSPEADIPPGCLIKVNRGGNIRKYAASGASSVYSTHQEISLHLYEETP